MTTSLPCLLPFLSVSPWIPSLERAPAAAHPPAASVAAAAPAAAPEPPPPGSGQSCRPGAEGPLGPPRARRGELPRSAAACASRASFPPALRPRDGGALAPPRSPSGERAVLLSEPHATGLREVERTGRRKATDRRAWGQLRAALRKSDWGVEKLKCQFL